MDRGANLQQVLDFGPNDIQTGRRVGSPGQPMSAPLQRRSPFGVAARELAELAHHFLCCTRRTKTSEEKREYEQLRDALRRKQAEVRRLQEHCAALDRQ